MTNKEHLATWEFEGVIVYLDEHARFHADIGTADSPREISADSRQEIYDEIHKTHLTEHAGTNLDLPIMLDTGELVTLRRIHAGTGKWLTTPTMDNTRYSGRVGYYPCESTKDLLDKRNGVRQELEEINKSLQERIISLDGCSFYNPRHGEKAIRIAVTQDAVAAQYQDQKEKFGNE
jgi:hypothetical protein